MGDDLLEVALQNILEAFKAGAMKFPGRSNGS